MHLVQIWSLTAGTDSFTLTAGDDVVNGALNTLNNNDVILDTSTTDNDVLNAYVNSNNISARIQNVETLNITGEYATTGLALTNVSGTKVLNLDTKLASGTATVTDAASLNAAKIVAKDNVATLNVTSLSSGTRDAVTVDAGKATAVTITGSAGADLYDITLASGATLTTNKAASGDASDADTITVNTAGGTATFAGNMASKTFTINNTDATLTAKLNAAMVGSGGVGTASSSKIDVTGNADVVLVDEAAAMTASKGLALSNSGTGKVTLRLDGAVSGSGDFQYFKADEIQIKGAAASGSDVTVNQDTTVNLTGALVSGNHTFQVDNGITATAMGSGEGTLLLNVSESTASGGNVATANKVGTLILKATPDQAKDTANNARITLDKLTLDAQTKTAIFTGENNIEIKELALGAATVFSAQGATGAVKLAATGSQDFTFVGGTGKDNVKITASGDHTIKLFGTAGDNTLEVTGSSSGSGSYELHGGTGNDTIKFGGAGKVTVDVTKGGNNTITTGSGDDTIKGGAGNDTITAGVGADTITLGGGSNTIVIGSSDSVSGSKDTIKNFVQATDKVVVTGAIGSGDLDLTKINGTGAVTTTGDYAIGATEFKIEGLNTGNVANVVQLGDTTATPLTWTTGASGSTTKIVASDFNDNITISGSGNVEVTLGKGADKLTLVSASGSDVIKIAEGDSIVGAYDTIVNLQLAGSGSVTDTLDLASTTIKASDATVTGVTGFTKVSVDSKGLATFKNGDDTVAVTVSNFETIMSILSNDNVIANGETVVFKFGNDAYVFQGGATADTVVHLEGAAAATLDGLSAGTAVADTIFIA